MDRKCMYCGGDLPLGVRIDTKFCSDAHKDLHHNTLKKIEARRKKALKAISDIKMLMEEHPSAYGDGKWSLSSICRNSELTKNI